MKIYLRFVWILIIILNFLLNLFYYNKWSNYRERIQKKSLIVAASFASLSLFNSATAELVYKPLEQPVEPAKPDLKIESVNEKICRKISKSI